MPNIKPEPHPSFDEFVATIAALRAEDGCPWDKEQTHLSIAPNMVEEAYEAVDAIEQRDIAHLREELGDVLLQVVLQSQIAADADEFTIDDVCADVNAKMIRRHPHVFGDVKAGNANEVLAVWDKIKLEEQSDTAKQSDKKDGVLDGVPSSFPALTLAQKISRKVAAVGFEWETIDDIWDKVFEEIGELKDAYAHAPKDSGGKLIKGKESASDVSGEQNPEAAAYHAAELEFGDVLFTMVNIGRRMGLNAENALRATCNKFRSRWEWMESFAERESVDLQDMDIDQLEALWQKSKQSSCS